MTPDSPNGRVVVVSNASVRSFVHLSIHVDLAGCFINPQVEPYHVELFEMRFTPANGRGKAWVGYRGLFKPDHHTLIEDFDSGSPMITLSGDAMLDDPYLAAGEVLRWTLPGQCADAADPNATDHAVATGTFRIEKSGGSPPPLPPATTTSRTTGTPVTTTAVPGEAPPFRITRIVSPKSVRQGGPRGRATIYWTGSPSFPVTMHDEPASCPAGFTCSSETKVAAKHASPLTWAAWWCSGDATATWPLDFWFWLSDATGHRTQKVREQVLCQVG